MKTFVKDSQSRIVRYGIKCFQIIDGVKCYAFAHAKKTGNTLSVSDSFNYCVDFNGNIISGKYIILSEGTGKISDVICEKIQ